MYELGIGWPTLDCYYIRIDAINEGEYVKFQVEKIQMIAIFTYGSEI
jgi:hypothetical protein